MFPTRGMCHEKGIHGPAITCISNPDSYSEVVKLNTTLGNQPIESGDSSLGQWWVCACDSTAVLASAYTTLDRFDAHYLSHPSFCYGWLSPGLVQCRPLRGTDEPSLPDHGLVVILVGVPSMCAPFAARDRGAQHSHVLILIFGKYLRLIKPWQAHQLSMGQLKLFVTASQLVD